MATSSSTGTSSNPQQQQQSASDDYILPYLVVGTEVSAKFKGAFCEAKIKKCDLALKCKLTLKTTSGGSPSITVSYDQLRTATGGPITYNDLRPGSTVYVTKETAAAESSDKSISKAAAGELQQATLNKVIDQSEYSVVFNDGDEMTLKRSRIRYKGEKHFLDSETLNHAPLNNPEHFLFPIKNKSEAAAAASESESESVATTSSNKANSRSLSRSGKQQQQPTTTRVKREKEAPAEEAAGDDAESSGSSDVDSDSSDDYPPEEKDRFVAQLYKFMDDRGTPMNKVPAVNKVDLDLHKFFIVVKKNGGFNKVCKQRKWSEVYKKLNLPDINSANVSNLKSAYERYLHPYEDFYRKLGSTMCDLGSHRPSTSASASKRSLASELHQRAPASTSHLFKPRYLSQTQSSAQKIKQTTSTPTAASKSADRLTSTSSTTSTPPGAGGVGSASTTTPESQPAPATNKPATASSCDVSSMEDQLTIESLAKSLTTDIQTPGASAPTTAPAAAAAANSMLLSTSIASSDDADKTMSLAGGLPEDTLTLSGIARNISEDFKKSKKEAAAATTSSSFSSAATTTGSTTTPATALTPSGASAKRGRRGRRTSSESGLKILGSRPKSVKNEPRDDDADNDLDADNDDDDEETSKINDDTTDDEPKPKKKYARASSDLDTSSSTSKSTSNSSAFKRKSTIKSEQQTESDSQESMSHSFKLNQFTADDLEVNQLIEVKYGHGKTTYQAKIVKIEREDNTVWVHYLGWNNRYDEWIEISKIIRIFNENCSNKRRKPSKVGSAPVIATTVRRGASANDADSNGKSSTKKKTPSTSSASSSSSGDNKIDKPPPGSKRVSSQSSLDRQTSNEDATVATAASHPDNLLSIKEEILDYQSASGADNANDSEAHENVFEEPVVAKSSTATASAAANKEESEHEEIAAPVSSAISSSSSSPPDSNRVASIQPPDFSLEEFSTKPAAIISSTSGSMLPPATVTSQDPTQTLNNSSSSQIEVDVKKELATTPTVSISPLPPPPPPPAPSPATAATPAPSTPPGPSRRRTSTRVSSTNTVSSNNNTPLPVVESISDDNVSDANKTNVKSESELVTPIPPPPPVVVPSVPPTTGFSDEDFKENKKDKQNKSNTTETSLNNSNNNAQSNNQETNSQSNGVLKTHGSATFNTIQNEPLVFSKYPFHLNGCTFTGKARIRFIEEQMRLCREEYMKLKNEISAIDRKRKLKRSQHDKTNNDGESNSAANSSILNASTSQKK